jgi:hypothetical protein
VYKLVAIHGAADLGVAKRSSGGKATRPGIKQVWRSPAGDLVGLADELAPRGGRPLLVPIDEALAGGLAAARARCLAAVAALPASLRTLGEGVAYAVGTSPRLEAATREALGEVAGAE